MIASLLLTPLFPFFRPAGKTFCRLQFFFFRREKQTKTETLRATAVHCSPSHPLRKKQLLNRQNASSCWWLLLAVTKNLQLFKKKKALSSLPTATVLACCLRHYFPGAWLSKDCKGCGSSYTILSCTLLHASYGLGSMGFCCQPSKLKTCL